VSETTKSMRETSSVFGKGTIREMGLQTFPAKQSLTAKTWRFVPQSGSGDRKCSIADGWKAGATGVSKYVNDLYIVCVWCESGRITSWKHCKSDHARYNGLAKRRLFINVRWM